MPIFTVSLMGHLTRDALQESFEALELPDEGMICLVVDCLAMTGYDIEARHAFVEWNRDHRARVTAVAVVTTKVLWQVVVGGMSLASGQRMKAFDTKDECLAWLATCDCAGR